MRILRLVLLPCLVALVVGGCGSGEDQTSSGEPSGATQVLVDTDGGWDDLKAVLYLLEQPDLEIVGIAVSGTGITHCPKGAENFSALLERIGAPDIPVACGRETPLAGNNAAPAAWRSGADSVGGVTLPEPRPLSDLDAPNLLRETVNSNSGVTLVALGPLTNVAEAIEADPSSLEKVEMMYLMGGAVDAGGNVLWANETAEFNIWADPKAAALVFATELPITLVPLDATNDVPVTTYMYEVLAAHRDASPTSQFVAEYLDASPLFGGLYHWDELAAVVATDESVVTIEERLLTVVEDGIDQGATMESPDGRPVRVAVATNREAFEDRFYKAMIGTAETGVAAWEPDAVVSWDGTTCTYDGPDPLPVQFYIRLDNESTELMAFVTGIYAADATVADLDAARQTSEPGLPDWWLPQGELFAPVGGHDVWSAAGGPNTTGLCFIDTDRMWEVAGPRLPE